MLDILESFRANLALSAIFGGRKAEEVTWLIMGAYFSKIHRRWRMPVRSLGKFGFSKFPKASIC